MVKKRNGIDKEIAFQKACELNGIKLTPKFSNKSPVTYIDSTGKKRVLSTNGKEHKYTQVKLDVSDEIKVNRKEVSIRGKESPVLKGVVVKPLETAGGQEVFVLEARQCGLKKATISASRNANTLTGKDKLDERIGRVSKIKSRKSRKKVGKKNSVKGRA